MTNETNGTLNAGEPHPASLSALYWLRSQPKEVINLCVMSFTAAAGSGNRLGEVCLETMNRIMEGKPVSDRYLLGLAWAIRDCMDTVREQNTPPPQQKGIIIPSRN